MSTLELSAVIFDMDGTLFDTETLSLQTWLAVGREYGWPQVADRYPELIGQNRESIRSKMREWLGPDFPLEEFLQTCSSRTHAHIEQEGVPLKPGATEVLALLAQRGIPMALATSTGRDRALRRMELSGLGHYFSVITAGDQVSRGKPDPEIYLTSCRTLSVSPRHALAVEDSPNGICSALNAGIPTVWIPDLLPLPREVEARLFQKFDSLLALRDYLFQILPA
mgnify:FL=1